MESQTHRVCFSYSRGFAHALARTRTVTPCGTTPSRWRVYQFHHQGEPVLHGSFVRRTDLHTFQTTGSTGLEPATSRVTVECSNQAELRPLNCPRTASGSLVSAPRSCPF